jgi:hypothetical protein
MAQGNRVRDPLDKATLFIESDNTVSTNICVVCSHKRLRRRRVQHMRRTELPSARVGIRVQYFVNDGVEIHEPGIFSQVVLWLAQECVCLTITPMNCDFARFCKRPHDVDVI